MTSIKPSSMLLAACLLIISTPLMAEAQTVFKGAKGGLNFATFGNTDADLERKAGFTIGGFVKMDMPGSPLSFQPEIYYSQKGAKSGDSEENIEYLEVPVLFKFNLLPAGPARPNIFVGPYAALNLSAQQSSGGLFGSPGTNYEDVDYGGVVGAGIDVAAGSSLFTIEARYSFGLSGVYTTGDERNNVIAVLVGISME